LAHGVGDPTDHTPDDRAQRVALLGLALLGLARRGLFGLRLGLLRRGGRRGSFRRRLGRPGAAAAAVGGLLLLRLRCPGVVRRAAGAGPGRAATAGLVHAAGAGLGAAWGGATTLDLVGALAPAVGGQR